MDISSSNSDIPGITPDAEVVTGSRRRRTLRGDSPPARRRFIDEYRLNTEQARDLEHADPRFSWITERYNDWLQRNALRRRYEYEHSLRPGKLERGQHNMPMDDLHHSYTEWLGSHGIPSESGRITKRGRAFMDESMEALARGAYGAKQFWSEQP